MVIFAVNFHNYFCIKFFCLSLIADHIVDIDSQEVAHEDLSSVILFTYFYLLNNLIVKISSFKWIYWISRYSWMVYIKYNVPIN
jgi:hypothetical protein